MASFKDIQAQHVALAKVQGGTLSRKAVVLPLSGASFSVKDGVWEGPTVTLDVRPLEPFEDALVLRGAREFAKAAGVDDPKADDPTYDLGLSLHTLLLACVDHDSPTDDPKPFFDSVEQIQRSGILTRDHIALLFEHQATWQDECGQRVKDMGAAEYIAAVVHTAGGNLPFFLGLRPGMQWSLVRTMASQLLDSQALKSPSSLPFEAPQLNS